MLNFRLLYTLLDSRRIQIYLAVLSAAGVGVLLDVLLVLKLSVLAGPWITMAVLAVLTAAGVLATYYLVDTRSRHLKESIHSGVFNENNFMRYLVSLFAGIFLAVPGVVNTVFGLIILLPPVSARLGDAIERSTGIDWTEAYEYLRLNYVAADTRDGAESEGLLR